MARRIDSQRALIQLEEGEGHRSGRLAISISRLGISHDSWWRRARPAQRWLSVARTPARHAIQAACKHFPGHQAARRHTRVRWPCGYSGGIGRQEHGSRSWLNIKAWRTPVLSLAAFRRACCRPRA